MESVITPLERIKPIQQLDLINKKDGAQAAESSGVFKDIYTSAINNVVETDYASVIDTENLATGNVDDLHNLGIDNMKSYLSVSMLVQLRNKALESYNQIMQITV